MALTITKAVRKQKKFKGALIGPAGSGKTKSALRIARGLVGEKGRILVADTERSSAALYADTTDFDHVDLVETSYERYLEVLDEAERLKYDAVILDSLSHAWESLLEEHELEASRTRNSFTAWAKITPKYNELINAIVAAPCHVIATMRAKTEYVLEDKNGKQTPKRVGLAAVMRPGSEYEFDVVGMIDIDHNMAVEKTRIEWLADKIVKKPDEKFGAKIREWLDGGSADAPKPLPAALPAKMADDFPPGMGPDEDVKRDAPDLFVYDLKVYAAEKGDKWPAIKAALERRGLECKSEALQVWASREDIPNLAAYLVQERVAA